MPDFLRVNGRVHHFRFRPGDGGRALVFANSLGTDLRIWDEVIAGLPEDLPILSYDKSGHGLSEGGTTSIEEFASDLASLMDNLHLKDALVCGVSVGGMIAQALAAARPDLVAGLVLCNTAHRIGDAASWQARISALDTTGLEAMCDDILERWFSPQFFRSAPDQVQGYGMMLSRTPLPGYRAVCAAIRDADLTESTSKLRCPTLCVSGSDDQATPPEIVTAMAALIPGSRSICFDNVGHLPCLEIPGPLANEILSHWRALP